MNPDDDGERLPPTVAALRAAVRDATAIVFCTPEYAGALPGSLKNLLDWCVGDDAPGSIYEKPAAWINVSPRGATDAHDELRRVLGYAHATIVEPACAAIPLTSAMVDQAGLISDPAARAAIADAARALAATLGG
jgi:NAD(P)H-dependent FMN reductase